MNARTDMAADPSALLAALAPDRIACFHATEAWTGASITIADAEDGRYMVGRVDPNGSARSEWRSAAWVRRAIADGHWLPPAQAEGATA